MMFRKQVILAGLLAVVVLTLPACTSTTHKSGPSDTVSVHQKVRQDQLSDMSREDARRADAPATKRRRPVSRDRLKGQGVVDQPGVPR